MSVALNGLHPTVRRQAELTLLVARLNGIRPVITSTVRTFAEQRRLRTRFELCLRSGPVGRHREVGCRFPANRPGDSAHNFGLAWDSVVPAAQLRTWTAIREWAGFRVPPNDVIHAEVPGWRRVNRSRFRIP